MIHLNYRLIYPEVSVHEVKNDTYCYQRENRESSCESSCNLEKNFSKDEPSERKCHLQVKEIGHQSQTNIKINERNNLKNQDCLSTESYHKRGSTKQSVLFTVKTEMSKENLRVKCSQKRRGSLSEGNNPDVSVGEAVGHATASSVHRSGTVSDAGGDYGSIGSRTAAPVQSLTRFSPTSLLVESLIDQLCKLMEKDSGRQKKLYHGG